MSVEDAKRYMKRMREDKDFRAMITQEEDMQKNWERIHAEGYDFTPQEFKQAQREEYETVYGDTH
ncbi:Nif11-like leader peptide family natural product precursor [Desulfovibrio inopinatus]|uniref:Nif11-like leader peptide family natural product precursor n=1 Tax=Desulfovibrio inopinatus TaxID=102109 RepID=UPI000412A237|nr:Nif11-like leader peptide family natural product precursor [Desulfovibrio inopinatus]